jgi:hypothetical protein
MIIPQIRIELPAGVLIDASLKLAAAKYPNAFFESFDWKRAYCESYEIDLGALTFTDLLVIKGAFSGMGTELGKLGHHIAAALCLAIALEVHNESRARLSSQSAPPKQQ